MRVTVHRTDRKIKAQDVVRLKKSHGEEEPEAGFEPGLRRSLPPVFMLPGDPLPGFS